MMTFMKYLLLMLAVIIFTTSSTLASVTGNTKLKHKIYAHTGQDPVHRSIDFPDGRKPFTGDIWNLDIQEVAKEVTANHLDSIDWSIIFNKPIVLKPDSISVTEYPYFMSVPTRQGIPTGGGGAVPSPPAIPLLLLGIVSYIRRKH